MTREVVSRRRLLCASASVPVATSLVLNASQTSSSERLQNKDESPSLSSKMVTITLVTVGKNGGRIGDVRLTVTWGKDNSTTIVTVASGEAFVDVPEGAEITIEVSDPEYTRVGPSPEYTRKVTDDERIRVEISPRTSTSTPTRTPTSIPTQTTPIPAPTSTSTSPSTVTTTRAATLGSTDTPPADSESPTSFRDFLYQVLVSILSTQALVAIGVAFSIAIIVITWDKKVDN